ncbi:MAG: hypothetical protein MZV64_68025 [Ignavibacteriales bacterium]|nr:hypothetical protein [Ignavibacteriales bacterium]
MQPKAPTTARARRRRVKVLFVMSCISPSAGRVCGACGKVKTAASSPSPHLLYDGAASDRGRRTAMGKTHQDAGAPTASAGAISSRSSATAGLGAALAGAAFGQTAAPSAPAAAAAKSRRRAPGGRHRLRAPRAGSSSRPCSASPRSASRPSATSGPTASQYTRQLPQEVRPRRRRLRGLPRAAGQGEGPRRGRRRHPRLGPRRARQRLPRGAASTSTAKRRCPTRSRRRRSMVLAARETGKLLQIGHQRRSNPALPPRHRQAASAKRSCSAGS